MPKKIYEGNIKSLSSNNILLNIKYLAKGEYILKIINKNKIIKTIKFKKK